MRATKGVNKDNLAVVIVEADALYTRFNKDNDTK